MKLKKILITFSTTAVSILSFAGCASTGSADTANPLVSVLPLLIIFVVMYIAMILPENKRKKKAEEMRNSTEVGDKIITIGGITGKVVHVSGDKVTFETGEDRVRIEVMKWAISTNEGKGANKETQDSEETLHNS